MRMPNGQPGPPTLKAAITGTQTGSTDGVRLSLAPGDTTGPSAVVRETAPGQLAWAMPCLDGPGRPCRQLVVLLVEAQPSTTDRKLRLAVTGDLQYPTFVPTPGWSSFDLDLATGRRSGRDGAEPCRRRRRHRGPCVGPASRRRAGPCRIRSDSGLGRRRPAGRPSARAPGRAIDRDGPGRARRARACSGDGLRRGRDGRRTAGCPTWRGPDDLVGAGAVRRGLRPGRSDRVRVDGPPPGRRLSTDLASRGDRAPRRRPSGRARRAPGRRAGGRGAGRHDARPEPGCRAVACAAPGRGHRWLAAGGGCRVEPGPRPAAHHGDRRPRHRDRDGGRPDRAIGGRRGSAASASRSTWSLGGPVRSW